jgi:hypothetical protein
MPRANQSGNIVVYVLGAILLMGLLIVMVRGANTPGTNIDAEQVMIKVSEVQQYSAELERAVQFIMQNGYSETDIRFAHPDADNAYGDIDDDHGRQVFHRMGGGATFRAPPSGIQTTPTPWVFTAANRVNRIGIHNEKDLVAILPNLTRGACMDVNRRLNIDNPSDDPPLDGDYFTINSLFAGSFGGSSALLSGGSDWIHTEGCLGATSNGGGMDAGSYHYYRVLLVR